MGTAGYNVEGFGYAIRTVCEPIFEKPLAEISFGHVLLNLFNTAPKANMEVQPQPGAGPKTLICMWRVSAVSFIHSWIYGKTGKLHRRNLDQRSGRFSGSGAVKEKAFHILDRKNARNTPNWCVRQFAPGTNNCNKALIKSPASYTNSVCGRDNPATWYWRNVVIKRDVNAGDSPGLGFYPGFGLWRAVSSYG